jgi:hypothetical protein
MIRQQVAVPHFDVLLVAGEVFLHRLIGAGILEDLQAVVEADGVLDGDRPLHCQAGFDDRLGRSPEALDDDEFGLIHRDETSAYPTPEQAQNHDSGH